MSKKHSIRCYDYVNHPYAKVRAELFAHAEQVFRKATSSAESRAETVAAGLHVNIAGLEIGKDIEIKIKGLDEVEHNQSARSSLILEWKAASAPGLFPVMDGELSFYPITGTETQLDFQGSYQPPLGVLGKALDAVVGHRIAEASVHQFILEVASYLREHIDAGR